MRANRAIAALAAAAALLCAACSSADGSDPSSAPPVSSQPPTSPATASESVTHPAPPHPTVPAVPSDVPRTGPNTRPGEKPPVMPLEATQHTADGAKAFAEFFVRTIDWGYATVSGAYIAHYSAVTCQTCSSLVSGLNKDRASRNRYIGGRLAIRDVELSSTTGHPLVVTVNSTSFEKVSAANKFITADEAHSGLQYYIYVRWTGHWSAHEVEVQL